MAVLRERPKVRHLTGIEQKTLARERGGHPVSRKIPQQNLLPNLFVFVASGRSPAALQLGGLFTPVNTVIERFERDLVVGLSRDTAG